MHILSKSQLKSQLLKKLRIVEKERKPLLITHDGRPVVQIVPYTQNRSRSSRNCGAVSLPTESRHTLLQKQIEKTVQQWKEDDAGFSNLYYVTFQILVV